MIGFPYTIPSTESETGSDDVIPTSQQRRYRIVAEHRVVVKEVERDRVKLRTVEISLSVRTEVPIHVVDLYPTSSSLSLRVGTLACR